MLRTLRALLVAMWLGVTAVSGAPSVYLSSYSSSRQNMAPGTTVITLSSYGATPQPSYQLISGSSYFEISGSQLKFTVSQSSSYESYSGAVQACDNSGCGSSSSFYMSNSLSSPDFYVSHSSVAEYDLSAGDLLITTLSGNMRQSWLTGSYFMSYSSNFELVGNRIRAKRTVPPGTYSLSVSYGASSGVKSSSSVSVTVLAPQWKDNPPAQTLARNAAIGYEIAAFDYKFSNGETPDVPYSAFEIIGGPFVFNGKSLVVHTNALEVTTYSTTVTFCTNKNSRGNCITQDFDITVVDLTEFAIGDLKQAYRSLEGCGDDTVNAPAFYTDWLGTKPTAAQIKDAHDTQVGCE